MKKTNLSHLLLWLAAFSWSATAEVGRVQEVAPGIYFREGDLARKGHCNNAWIVFEDYVVAIDANFPNAVEELLPQIRRTTSKPVRFVVDTHHHGDHAYGNLVWARNGAIIVAQEKVLEEFKRYEPKRWEEALKSREDVRNLVTTGLKLPTLVFPDRLVFDDGQRRLELIYFGFGHSRGDSYGFMPKEKILFTGDACLNGPYNYMGDGNSEGWIRALEAAEKLDFEILVPGHGPLARNGRQVLAGQKQFFVELRKQVTSGLEARKSLDEIKRSVLLPESVRNWVGDGLPSQVEQVYKEMTGQVSP